MLLKNTKYGISSAVLKNIAVITMFIDHFAAIILKEILKSQGIANLYDSPFYYYGRVIGRIAFVIYAYMIAVGAEKTKNKLMYAGRLLALALISIVPHSMANVKKWFDPNDLNVFFLLFTGLVIIYAIQFISKQFEKKKFLSVLCQIVIVVAGCLVAHFANFEYGLFGILLIVGFYYGRDNWIKTLVIAIFVMTVGYSFHGICNRGLFTWFESHSSNWFSAAAQIDKVQVFGLLALPFILLTNGQKGKQLSKWFYYFFYPVHLGIFALIKIFLL